jgi:hypothetical protein
MEHAHSLIQEKSKLACWPLILGLVSMKPKKKEKLQSKTKISNRA